MDDANDAAQGRVRLSRRRVVGGAVAAALHAPAAPFAAAQPVPGATPVADAGAGVAFGLADGSQTRGQFDLPAAGAPPYPAVLLVQGSGPTDRHETIADADGTRRRPFDQIVAALTARGVAVFRFDKRGVCPPSAICDRAAYASRTRQSLIDDAALAYARMVGDPRVDPGRTAVLGHSEGSWVASALPGRFPAIRAVVLIGTGLGPMAVLTFSQVTLPLLGIAPFDRDGDGALAAADLPFADPAAMGPALARARAQGQLFLFRYAGVGADLRPVGLNSRLDADGDGRLNLLTEVRPAYEALLANLDDPVAVVERFADPSILPTARAAFAAAGDDARLYASYLAEPMDANLRQLAALPTRPAVLIVNGENDDQTPASSARALAVELEAAGFPAALRIHAGLGHLLSPQADMFAPYSAEMAAEPLRDIAGWVARELAARRRLRTGARGRRARTL